MRRLGIFVVFISVAAVGIYFAVQNGLINLGLNTTRCRHDQEIPQALRDEASQAALRFVDAILKSDLTSAYQMGTKDLKTAVTVDAFNEIAKQIQSRGPFANLRIDQIYFPELSGSPGRAVCDTASANPDEHWVFVDALPGETQIDAILLGSAKNNDWAFTIVLLKRAGAWQVQSYYAAAATTVGHSAADLMKLAEAQDQKGNALNATMLYAVAGSLLNRGPSFQLGLTQAYDTKVANHKAPPELSGTPPFVWRLDGKDYGVDQVLAFGVDGKLAMQFRWRDVEWDGVNESDGERRNKAFLDAFRKAHPEFKEVFGFLISRLLPKTGEKGWGTVYEVDKGYH